MVVEFDSKKKIGNVGNKAKFLMEMKSKGFNVPNGIVVDSDTYTDEIKYNKIDSKIKRYLNKLNTDNVLDISMKIYKLFDSFKFSSDTEKSIISKLNKKTLYAVRSSGTKEDLDEFSFAGQYDSFLNVSYNDVLDRIIDCYKSMFSDVILSYFLNNNISFDDIKMSVVVQEMVPSEYSGICFTVDPITGNDKKMLIEIAPGLGENIVSGQNKPEQYYYDWFNDECIFDDNNSFINEKILRKIGLEFSHIMLYFGYPCDIEFAIVKNKLYILQARRITKIEYQGFEDLWTTADFKDGGVSASVCTPYMWSLYEYIWEYTLRKFILDSKILRKREFPKKVGEMFYGRCYWNLSTVKKAMSKVVGYRERDFDNEYGIAPNYDGDGETTGINPLSLVAIIRMAIAQNKIVKTREKNSLKLKNDLLTKYYYYKGMYDTNSICDIKKVWKELTHNDYLMSESTYFWQIFINTIHQSLNKDNLLKYIEEADYLQLISSIDDISHLLPFYEMWDVSRLIRNDKESFIYWKNNSVSKIIADFDKDKNSFYFDEVLKIINRYGYHSDKELDVTYPCYYEEIDPIIINIKDLVNLDDSYSPLEDQERGKKLYQKKLKEIKKKINEKDYLKLERKIVKIREMLWWREEFRDISTRFYYLIRIYTILLAKKLCEEKVLDNTDDIWFLKVGNLWDYLDGKLSSKDLKIIIEKNKKYYDSYRNYMSENEIGSKIGHKNILKKKNNIQGLGANNGIVTGTARVIESFDEIDRLREGDILVTKFTDTGWTPKFAILSGIVTEFGGVLCHAAIVSREYGIPAIVSCTGVMNEIKDGEIITINGTTGEIKKGK